MPATLDEIRRKGLEVLRRHLGRAGMIRFLQQFETGRGDYAHERHKWVDGTSLDELREKAGKAAPPKNGRKSRKRKSG
jgi:hypothetical protein